MEQDILADEDGGVLALYRADNQTDANNTLGLYVTAWPLLYVAGGVTESRSANLAARAVCAIANSMFCFATTTTTTVVVARYSVQFVSVVVTCCCR